VEEGVRMKTNRPLRVAMVAYASYFTDARIKNYVDALLDAGASVDVFALGKAPGKHTKGRLYVNNLGRKYPGTSTMAYLAVVSIFMAKAAWHLFLRALGGRYDVIHVHNMPDFLSLVGLPFKVFGTKVILDIHDTMPEAYATKGGYELQSLPIRLLVAEQTVSAACADKIITTNSLHKEVLSGHGIPDRKIALIYNVGNHKIFKPKSCQINGQELWLGYHGTIATRLGVLLVVDALSVVKSSCPGVRLLCVGGGDALEAMKQRAAEQDVTHMIEWQSFVDVEALPEVLQRVQIGIVGNLQATERKKNYMLPVKMLEYAAMEIPTIAPRLRILQRYFDDTSAIFYEPDDPEDLANTIRMLYNDRSLIAIRIDGLRKFNAEYNWDKMAKRYLHIVEELTKR
jgi:glycosyltransferase involved in cell wall biosynthesis